MTSSAKSSTSSYTQVDSEDSSSYHRGLYRQAPNEDIVRVGDLFQQYRYEFEGSASDVLFECAKLISATQRPFRLCHSVEYAAATNYHDLDGDYVTWGSTTPDDLLLVTFSDNEIVSSSSLSATQWHTTEVKALCCEGETLAPFLYHD